LSRIRTLVLLATVAVLAVAFAACGGGGGDSSDEDPQQVLDTATLKGVESGNLNLALSVKASGGDNDGNVDVKLSGPFQAGAKGALPEADMKLSVNGNAEGESIDFSGGVTLLSDRAFVEFEDEAFEVDPTTFGFVKSGFEQAQQESQGEGPEAVACQEAAANIKVGDFIDNIENEGSQDVEGTDTTEVSGDLNIKGAIDQVIKLTEDPACSSQLEAAGPLPLGQLEEAADTLEKEVKSAHAAVYVGNDDNIVRKMTAELEVEPESSGEKVDITFDISLGEVNEKQTFEAPANAKPLEELFQKIGVNPLELLEGMSGGSGGLDGLLEGSEGGSESSTEGVEEALEGSEQALEESLEELPGSEESQAYIECLQGAENASDLQKCASELK
jgi:hypothetical protein